MVESYRNSRVHIPSMKSLPLATAMLFVIVCACAQDRSEETSKNQSSVKAEGFTSQFLISSDFKGFYFNMVGGQIRYYKGDFSAAIAILPTLRFHKDEHLDPTDDLHPFVTPGFSVGPLFTYKRYMLGFPISYSYDVRWHPTVGLGYRFGKT